MIYVTRFGNAVKVYNTVLFKYEKLYWKLKYAW